MATGSVRNRGRSFAVWTILIVMAQVAVGFCPSGAGMRHAPSRRPGGASDSELSTPTGRGETAGIRMMASSVAPSRTKAEKHKEHFRLGKDGLVTFGSSQRVEVSVHTYVRYDMGTSRNDWNEHGGELFGQFVDALGWSVESVGWLGKRVWRTYSSSSK